CTLSANQQGGDCGTGLNDGQTCHSYAVSSAASCPGSNILSCSNSTLSCSTGTASDCSYSSCTPIAGNNSFNIWVSDTGNNRWQKLDGNGNYLLGITSPLYGNTQLGAPSGMATDSSGNVYVTDYSYNRVQKFNVSGSFLMGIGSGYQGAGGSIGGYG